jgi:hypothetical protein
MATITGIIIIRNDELSDDNNFITQHEFIQLNYCNCLQDVNDYTNKIKFTKFAPQWK